MIDHEPHIEWTESNQLFIPDRRGVGQSVASWEMTRGQLRTDFRGFGRTPADRLGEPAQHLEQHVVVHRAVGPLGDDLARGGGEVYYYRTAA